MEDPAFTKQFKREKKEARKLQAAQRRRLVADQRQAFDRTVERWNAEPGSELASLRMQVHRRFDTLWEFGLMSRSEMYRRLARALHIDIAQCHIGMFDERMCRRALAVRSDPIFHTENVDV